MEQQRGFRRAIGGGRRVCCAPVGRVVDLDRTWGRQRQRQRPKQIPFGIDTQGNGRGADVGTVGFVLRCD